MWLSISKKLSETDSMNSNLIWKLEKKKSWTAIHASTFCFVFKHSSNTMRTSFIEENINEKKGNIPYSLLVIKENSWLFFQKDKGQIRIKLLNLRKFRKMSVLSEYSMWEKSLLWCFFYIQREREWTLFDLKNCKDRKIQFFIRKLQKMENFCDFARVKKERFWWKVSSGST